MLPPLLLVIPMLGACVLLAGGRFLSRLLVDVVSTTAALASLAVAVLLYASTSGGRVVSWVAGWRPTAGRSVGIALVVDPASALICCLICAVGVLALVYGWRYFEDVRAQYHMLLLLFLAGLLGFTVTGDLFTMFVFFELMGATAYALTGFKVEEPESVQGAFSFGVVNSLGAYLCLIGIALLYARTGQLGLAQLGHALDGHPADALVAAGFVLIATGWLVKAAAVPFHFWLVDAHAVAPTPVCVLFSGVMAPLGVYGIARVYWTVFAGTSLQGPAERVFLVLGLITAVLGTVMCVSQRHLKRLLAYSTIAHIGLFLIGVSTLDSAGTAATGVYLVGHAGVKGALFLLTGVLLARHQSVDEIDLHRTATVARFRGVLFVIGALALAGLPPFGTALGKDLLESTGGQWLMVLIVMVSATTGGAVLRAGLRVHFGLGPAPASTNEVSSGEEHDPEVDKRFTRTPATMIAAIGGLLAIGLAAGILPGVSAAAATAAARFTDHAGYVSEVLFGACTNIGPVPVEGWSGTGIASGVLSAALAGVVAAVAIWAGSLPRWIRSGAQKLRPLISALHRLHSGHVGDYAAWLVAGAALTALLVFG